MLKKLQNIIFICLFLGLLAIPLALTDFSGGGISSDENRKLAPMPKLLVEGKFNGNFTGEFETWFMDHLGLREQYIGINAQMQCRIFDRFPSNSAYLIGRNGDLNYATDEMLKDYAHLNLRSQESVANIADSYQTLSDYVESRGAQFYYIQCYDKHSIYPEDFIDTVQQHGNISKTDQVISQLEQYTTVSTISFKKPLLDAKSSYDVFSSWGDPTHWSDRGAFVAYQYMMEQLNRDFDGQLKVLQEEDYHITVEDVGVTVQTVHKECMSEVFRLKDPQATEGNIQDMAPWVDENWHAVRYNTQAGNDLKLLFIGDSYFYNYLADDMAESFGSMWFLWGEYLEHLPEIMEKYQPDIVIFECAERVDRSHVVVDLAQRIRGAQEDFLKTGTFSQHPDYRVGPNGDLNYATAEILKDFAHENLRSDKDVAKIANGYQTVSDYVERRGAQFYYVQCFDKHSIYPECFLDMEQKGNISKTDQVISQLEQNTTVNTISFKKPLLDAKSDYDVFTRWGDPTHWSQRGAFVAYQYMMERLNQDFDGQLKVLQEEDYQIEVKDVGMTLQTIHQECMGEVFTLKQAAAVLCDSQEMAPWTNEQWHTIHKNPEAGNQLKLLILGDSYFYNFLVDDIAESFGTTWFLWGNYIENLAAIMDQYQPDIVILQCAERVDRSQQVIDCAALLTAPATDPTEPTYPTDPTATAPDPTATPRS